MLKLGEFLKVFKETEDGVSTYPIVEFCKAIDFIKLHTVGNDPNTAIATTFDYYIGAQDKDNGRKVAFENMKDFSEYITTYHNDYFEILQLIIGLKGTFKYKDKMLDHFKYATALDVAPSTRMFHMGFVINAILTAEGFNANEALQTLLSKLCDFAISYINMETDVYLYLSEIGKAGK